MRRAASSQSNERSSSSSSSICDRDGLCRKVANVVFFFIVPFAYGLVMAGFAVAALLDRETAMVSFGGFRWMLMTALIYEFVLFGVSFVAALLDTGSIDKRWDALFHFLVTVVYVFPFAMFQVTYHENKYQDDPNWRSNWGVALGFVMIGSYVPLMIRSLIEACPNCSDGYRRANV